MEVTSAQASKNQRKLPGGKKNIPLQLWEKFMASYYILNLSIYLHLFLKCHWNKKNERTITGFLKYDSMFSNTLSHGSEAKFYSISPCVCPWPWLFTEASSQLCLIPGTFLLSQFHSHGTWGWGWEGKEGNTMTACLLCTGCFTLLVALA